MFDPAANKSIYIFAPDAIFHPLTPKSSKCPHDKCASFAAAAAAAAALA